MNSDASFTPSLPGELKVDRLESLSPDKQHVYLFTWLSDLNRFLSAQDSDGATAHQMFVKNELGKLTPFSSSILTRPIRMLVGRCYVEIYTKGDRKTLYDVLNDLLNALNAGKADKNIDSKFFLVHVIGDVFGCAGDSVMSMAAHGVLSLMRLIKASSNNAGYRTAIFRSLSQIFSLCGSFIEENLGRDMWKQARYGTQDKSSLVRAAALDCLREMFKTVPYFNNASDLDHLRSIVVKALDTPQSTVRKSASQCWASAIIVATTVTTSVVEVPVKKSKKPPPPPNPDAEEGSNVTVAPPQQPPQTVKKVVQNVTISFEDGLKILSNAYTKSGSLSPRVKAGIIETYTELFMLSGSADVEKHYLSITKNLLDDILSHPNVIGNRNRKLLARRQVVFLLNEVIGQQLLGEPGRLHSATILVNEFLKNYPRVIKDRYEPSKYALTGAVLALKYLIETLGSAIIADQKPIRDALLLVLQHPNYTVQMSACSCIRAFLLHVPALLVPTAASLMNSLNRDLAVLKSRRVSWEVAGRCNGYASGLATVISVASLRPQFASLDLASRIFTLATGLLKASGDVDVLVSTAHIQVAWMLMSGLMSLGPTFVKLHLSQLLLLWKSALPKPLSKDAVTDKNVLEYSFLTYVRECALSSILAFLRFNKRLITSDVAKRIISLMQNTTAYLNLLLSKKIIDDQSMRLHASLTLVDYEMMVRRRVLQCYTTLIEMRHGDSLQAEIITTAVSLFAEPDAYISPLSTTIAANAGAFESVWEVADNYAYGVTSMIQNFNLAKFGFESPNDDREMISRSWLTTESFGSSVERMLNEPTIGAVEHDFVAIFGQSESESGLVPWQVLPKSSHTAVVDLAIELFVLLLPMQTEKIQQSILEQVASFMGASTLQKDPGRRAAITANVAMALSGTLKLVASAKHSSRLRLTDEAVLNIMQELLKSIAVKEDAFVRMIAADAIGRLCAIAGPNFTGYQVKQSVEEIVHNRDPHARAGLALSFGSINSHVGGMAAGTHLKTIAGILMSLCNDPHPVVHFWALKALASTMESAGLSFSGFSSSVIGMLCTLYLSDTHNGECTSVISSNLEADFSTVRVIAHCIDAFIGVLGPDLQDMSKNRELVSLLVQEISLESDPFAVVESLKCYQHAILFAPQYFDRRSFCLSLTKYINSPIKDLRDAAIDGYYQLARNDVNSVFASTGRALEGHIWLAFDMTPWHEGVKSIILTWLSQTGVSEARHWVARCQAVLVKLVARRKKQPLLRASTIAQIQAAEPDLKDEEVAGFAAAADDGGEKQTTTKANGGEPLKWQTRVFALKCLKEMLAMNKPTLQNLVPKVGDIIRAAFAASTSNVLEMRLVGVSLLDDVLLAFGKMPDPEFDDVPLLDQFQAQIASALTPAFASDSSPELAAEAINVCADFIASGIVTDVAHMGRVLKLLISALDSCTAQGDEITVGELKSLSSNSTVMLRLAILSAWAELQIASANHAYLIEVTKPHITKLAPLWLGALKEFAQLRFEPESDNETTSLSNSVGTKDSVLLFYEQSWLKIVEAIATVIDQEPQMMIAALEGHSGNGTSAPAKQESDGSSFFFVLFGICFEALVKAPNGDVLASKQDMPRILRALQKVMRPDVCGSSIYQPRVFVEIVDLFDRIALTEGYDCQEPLIGVLRSMCIHHPATKREYEVDIDGNDTMSDGTDQMFDLLRAVISILAQIHPAISESGDFARPLTDDAVNVTRVAMDAAKDMVEAFSFDVRIDLYATYLHMVGCLIEAPECQETAVPAILPSLKQMLRNVVKSTHEADHDAYGQIVQETRSFIALFTTVLDRYSDSHDSTSLLIRKNCLLALVVVITSTESILAANDPLIEECCTVVIDSFNDSELAPIAAQCARSLLLSSSRSSFAQILGRKLLPQLVALAAGTDGAGAGGDSEMAGVIGDVLVAFIKSLHDERVAPAMAVCIPVILYSVQDERQSGAQRKQLVELANTDGLSFKSVVSSLTAAQRMKMERLLRAPAEEDEESGEADAHSAPTIQLKMNFGF
ncbi:armadillo-type protein [Myxozyma melibiosi]|uniref:Armadillo-type protein n=1 Tax=Myxozyma melibiosi TaxID=54550 RepID=A0ABR1F5T6_9ASCO